MYDPVVTLQRISKTYSRAGTDVSVLRDLSFTIPAGTFLAIMGPSGSGKSTLLNVMAGIDRPTSGSVVVAGTRLDDLSEGDMARWRARHIGYVFQSYNLIPVLTASENVELPLLLTHLSRQERREHVKTALRLVGLGERMDHYPRQLSGGQEQRVGLARAIVSDPTMILADEPTGNLDRESAEDILTLFGRLNRELGKTIVMVTHDPRAAERAQMIRHLEKGILESPP
ncbi:MAG: ABC transporter ATP-binding protein [Nitrospira sp.]|uniref:ABC transporter ATP-binding protein n=1 Tax=Nitrospira sp. ND1 TaxID=1658518 RepID=UPI0009B9CAEB|nr:ABC transporter ATP-binding protein [Nitrospira sp. ND1]MBK7418858.1 ABC transporter ATP-binding protein [Nitrospira sp.]MBK7485583.1 ABC transporter ATP-binding protein [Nitrospira sp.]MBK8377484.1 ABC transporter ATP-binding protein [Nitrospira sp.]MBK9111826.1 ABC transporter ATP-binding protein [Nitrospira sp.]MBK9998889.1 ABC transporter ATP-binding protein [Nitrospira sp.]